jgi:hypothetical protein
MHTAFLLSPDEVKVLQRIMSNQISEFNNIYQDKLAMRENWTEDEFEELDQRFKLAHELYFAIEEGEGLVEYTTLKANLAS